MQQKRSLSITIANQAMDFTPRAPHPNTSAGALCKISLDAHLTSSIWGREINWGPLALEREEFVWAPLSGPTAPPILAIWTYPCLPPPGGGVSIVAALLCMRPAALPMRHAHAHVSVTNNARDPLLFSG